MNKKLALGHGGDPDGPLFRPLKNTAGQGRTERRSRTGRFTTASCANTLGAAGLDFARFGPHALRATAATNALDRGADWAGGVLKYGIYNKCVV
jgi:integrase/recombinase XerD